MNRAFQWIGETLSGVSAQEAVGGLLMGLVLSLAAATLCLLVRKKVADPFPFFCALILAVSALSMAFGAGYSRFKLDRLANSGQGPSSHHGRPSMDGSIGRRLLRDADRDQDGKLTPEEAAQFVKTVDRAEKGWADASDIDRDGRDWAGERPGLGAKSHFRRSSDF